jgi:hypothetical protein
MGGCGRVGEPLVGLRFPGGGGDADPLPPAETAARRDARSTPDSPAPSPWRGGGMQRSGGCHLKRFANLVDHAPHVFVNFVIAEA